MGAAIEEAIAAMVMVHGRGANAEDILSLVPEIDQPGFAYLAPQAAENTWYHYSFMAPTEYNQPGISSGLRGIDNLISELEEAGIPPAKVLLLGFSQGACLTLEYAARNPRRFGGIAGLSGGLIGPELDPDEYSGSLEDTPVFLGCSDVDSHVPKERVMETAAILDKMGGKVNMQLFQGMGHTINNVEINVVRKMMADLMEVIRL